MASGEASTGELFEPLIERNLEIFPPIARRFADSHSLDDLWVMVSRFAVLAYAPSQHARSAVVACNAVRELRDEYEDAWFDLIVACARYAAESRQPWSEPPLLDPPEVDPSWQPGAEVLREAVTSSNRELAERWLAARLSDADEDLRSLARGDALLVTDAVLRMAPHLGEKGRYALLRIAVWDMLAQAEMREELPTADESLDDLIARAIADRGSVASVRSVLIRLAERPVAESPDRSAIRLAPYRLARDFAQTLVAHSMIPRFPPGAETREFLAAVHENLEHGESYADWSFA